MHPYAAWVLRSVLLLQHFAKLVSSRSLMFALLINATGDVSLPTLRFCSLVSAALLLTICTLSGQVVKPIQKIQLFQMLSKWSVKKLPSPTARSSGR